MSLEQDTARGFIAFATVPLATNAAFLLIPEVSVALVPVSASLHLSPSEFMT